MTVVLFVYIFGVPMFFFFNKYLLFDEKDAKKANITLDELSFFVAYIWPLLAIALIACWHYYCIEEIYTAHNRRIAKRLLSKQDRQIATGKVVFTTEGGFKIVEK